MSPSAFPHLAHLPGVHPTNPRSVSPNMRSRSGWICKSVLDSQSRTTQLPTARWQPNPKKTKRTGGRRRTKGTGRTQLRYGKKKKWQRRASSHKPESRRKTRACPPPIDPQNRRGGLLLSRRARKGWAGLRFTSSYFTPAGQPRRQEIEAPKEQTWWATLLVKAATHLTGRRHTRTGSDGERHEVKPNLSRFSAWPKRFV